MLEDDGQIDERERTILERFRTRYNITPERAKELEAQAIASAQLTPAEQEYLEEYKKLIAKWRDFRTRTSLTQPLSYRFRDR